MTRKYRYYITDTFDGAIKGTDNKETADNCAQCEEYFVLDVESGLWIGTSDDTEPTEMKP